MDAHRANTRRLDLRLRSAIHADNTTRLTAVLAEDGQRTLDHSAALSLALRANRAATCAALMARGVGLKNPDDLNQAIGNGAARSVAAVLDAGLSITHVTESAVLSAIQGQHTETLNVLFERGLPPHRVPKLAYFSPVGRGDIAYLGRLLTAAPPNQETMLSLLGNAAESRNAAMAYCLFEHGGEAYVDAPAPPDAPHLAQDPQSPAREWLLVARSVWQKRQVESALEGARPDQSAPLCNALEQKQPPASGLGL